MAIMKKSKTRKEIQRVHSEEKKSNRKFSDGAKFVLIEVRRSR